MIQNQQGFNGLLTAVQFLAVGLGGALGAMARYGISLLPVREPFAFPIKTFCINVAGCFCIGLIAALAAKGSGLSPRTVLFLKAGFCGGFTTFSTFALETDTLLKAGQYGTAGVYVVLSIAAGIAALWAAQCIAAR